MATIQTLISQSLDGHLAKLAIPQPPATAPETVASLIKPRLAGVKEVVEGVKEGFETLMSLRDVLLNVSAPMTATVTAPFTVAATTVVDISASDRQHQLDLEVVKKSAQSSRH